MEILHMIRDELNIHPGCIRLVSCHRAVCLVQTEWLKKACNKHKIPTASRYNHSLSEIEYERLLAASTTDVPEPWERISVKVIQKRNEKVKCFPESFGLPHLENGLIDSLAYVTDENYRRSWQNAFERFGSCGRNLESSTAPPAKPFCDFVRDVIQRLHNCSIYPLKSFENGRREGVPEEEEEQNDISQLDSPHPNLIPLYCAFESDSAFYLLQPYMTYSLQDCVTLSPAILGNSYAKPLFIVYQILHALRHLHNKGLSLGNRKLRDILIDSKLWVQCSYPTMKSLTEDVLYECQKDPDEIAVNAEGKEVTSSNSSTVLTKGCSTIENGERGEGNGAESGAEMDEDVDEEAEDISDGNTGSQYHVSESVVHVDVKTGSSVGQTNFAPRAPSSTSQVIQGASTQLESVREQVESSLESSDEHFPDIIPDNHSALETDCAMSRAFLHDEPSLETLPKLTDDWINGRISNFKYIMALNKLAGRRMGDPNNHPVLPWVIDFTTPNGEYRDFSMSKYRLNKGDDQLDVMYNVSFSSSVPGRTEGLIQVPHHISDVLSDITYYVYKARRTPKDILCTKVRSKWVPREYPSSMQRMQEWTPDECIPEFFTDPSIFASIHGDLPDLEIPPWSSSPMDFVTKHMAILEGDYVSSQLHLWIDLTFGYKLSGAAAVDAKNVCLQLVDEHTNLTNHGVVQLFQSPHPQRNCGQKSFSSSLPPNVMRNMSSYNYLKSLHEIPQNEFVKGTGDPYRIQAALQVFSETVEKDLPRPGTPPTERRLQSDPGLVANMMPWKVPITLPENYDPLELLNEVERGCGFSTSVLHSWPQRKTVEEIQTVQAQIQDKVNRDMQILGCLLVEMFLSAKLHAISFETSFKGRCRIVRGVARQFFHELPRPIRHVVKWLLQLNRSLPASAADSNLAFPYRLQSREGLPPPNASILLEPTFQVISFPAYFPELYAFLKELRAADNSLFSHFNDVHEVSDDGSFSKLMKNKVDIFARNFSQLSPKLDEAGVELLMPYLKELFSDRATMVNAAWNLFGPVAKLLGPTAMSKHFLQSLTKLYDGENTTPKHFKLYHRTFLLQLLIRLGLEAFLSSFVTLLIEATSGYKDFIPDVTSDPSMTHDDNDLDSASMETDEDTVIKYDFISSEEGVASGFLDRQISEMSEQALQFDENFPEKISLDGVEEEDGAVACHHNNSTDTDSIGDQKSITSARSDLEMEDIKGGEVQAASNPALDVPSDDAPDSIAGSLGTHSTPLVPAHKWGSKGPMEVKESEIGARKRISSQTSISSADQTPEQKGKQTVQRKKWSLSCTLDSTMNRSEYNVRDVATETVKWLSQKLGPVLTAKHLSHNLLRMLVLCYLEEEQLCFVEFDEIDNDISACKKMVVGDLNASKILESLGYIAVLYGEQTVALQYFKHMLELVFTAMKRLTPRSEAGLVSCLTLLKYIIPYLSDTTLMDYLQDDGMKTTRSILKDMLYPTIELLSSTTISFPSGGHVRKLLCYKVVDVIYLICLRIGFEQTRQHMSQVMQCFFQVFDLVHERKHSGNNEPKRSSATAIPNKKESLTDSNELFLEIKKDSVNNEYKIGTPVCVADLISPTKSFGSSGSWHRRSHSLTPLEPVVPHSQADEDNPEQVATKEKIMDELRQTFTPEMAYTAYIPLCQVYGGIHMEQYLKNESLIRELCTRHDEETSLQNKMDYSGDSSDSGESDGFLNGFLGEQKDKEDIVTGSFGKNVKVVGNKLAVSCEDDHLVSMAAVKQDRLLPKKKLPDVRRSVDNPKQIDIKKLKCPEMETATSRHLKGNWLAYWEHEIGLSEKDTRFNFKQIKLQTFSNHTNSVRSIHVMDNENCFFSASKDKTVKLWSIQSFGDGSARSHPQWTYLQHRKPVLAVTFLESMRLAASSDSSVHIWDPFVGMPIRQFDSSKNNPVAAFCCMSPPHNTILCGTNEGSLRFLDVRAGKFMQEYKCVTGPAGVLRCVTVSPSGNWVAVGFSAGVLSLLDTRTGLLLGTWKGHEGDIMKLKAFNDRKFVTSGVDNMVHLWRTDVDQRYMCSMKGHSEPVHGISFYRNEMISITAGNKIGVHTSLDSHAMFSSTKLRSDTFKGSLTSMAVLPLNRMLLLGADNGSIKLLC
ncbi:WD repeat-containing protein 81 isoform X2 [Lingula anatina]|uniref:WD repeat-containing protein 81 isoform X2 n=1 Tax=Lingula anatina TaxID=7574 RepID=A0A1S3J7J5_LINAN|nr:WD repeat-containing protein 81 isoform X2 [Lingula anatina]|eukprot:XP_013406370.1 WD repeat-containing protein 81 isoform X2 [Lingula anatina]